MIHSGTDVIASGDLDSGKGVCQWLIDENE